MMRKVISLITTLFCLLAIPTSARDLESPNIIDELPAQFFPGLKETPADKIYLQGLMSVYPGRILDKAPEKESTNSTREPLVEELPRGITYLRVYDIASSREALNASSGLEALIIDLRYVSGTLGDAQALLMHFQDGADLHELQRIPKQAPTTDDPEMAMRSTVEKYEPFSPLTKPIVLFNHRTRGAIESALEALLREGRIMTVGTQTAGNTGSFKPMPGAKGFWVIESEVKATDGPSLLGVGLEPEVAVDVTPEQDFTGYQLLETGYSAEAILRAQLPSLSGDEAQEEDEANEENKRAVDPILQRAVEVVIALQILGKLPMP